MKTTGHLKKQSSSFCANVKKWEYFPYLIWTLQKFYHLIPKNDTVHTVNNASLAFCMCIYCENSSYGKYTTSLTDIINFTVDVHFAWNTYDQ